MNTTRNQADNRHETVDEIEALLPWHAVGALNRRDAAKVEQAISTDVELARKFGLVREELDATIHLNETLGAPSARAAEKLFAAIDAEAPARRASSFNLGAWWSEFMAGFAPRTRAFAGVAAAALILLQAGVLVSLVTGERAQGPYTVATDAVVPATEGTRLLIQFASTATAAEITAFLEMHKATVVDGPKSSMLFVVRIAEAGLSADEISQRVNQIRGEDVITFAAPAAN